MYSTQHSAVHSPSSTDAVHPSPLTAVNSLRTWNLCFSVCREGTVESSDKNSLERMGQVRPMVGT